MVYDESDEDTPPHVREKMILRPERLPCFYLNVKLHKSVVGVRPLHGNPSTPMVPVSSALSHCLQLLTVEAQAMWTALVLN